MAEPLIILGASARAAAFSALRAGLTPWTADLFADADLAARCTAQRVAHYPEGLLELIRPAPAGPWIYTGALENHPGLIDRIARERPLWGNLGTVLRQVRNPALLRQTLVEAGCRCPRLGESFSTLTPGVWMRKPRRSAGGAHIEKFAVCAAAEPGERQRAIPVVSSLSKHDDMATHNHYFQEFVAGEPSGGVFLAARGAALLLGVTRQLVGSTWAGANNFQYVGSVGPVLLDNRERQAWETTGACLASRFALTGLFGVDAIVNEDGVFVIEVNPRYTASVELLERAGNWSALALQKLACVEEHRSMQNLEQDFQHTPQARSDRPAAKTYGKAIVYATKQTHGSDAFWSFVAQANSGEAWPMAADLPNRGEAFQPGQPVLTVFAEGANESQVTQQLQVEASRVLDLL